MEPRNEPGVVIPLNIASKGPIAGGGGGPYDSDMHIRVARLERTTEDIRATLARLEPAITRIRDDANEIKGKMSQMPTVWTLVGLIVAIFGFAFVLVRFALPSH